MKPLNTIVLAIGLALGLALTIASTPASAGGYAGGHVYYHSGNDNNVGNPVIVRQYPNGRVEVIAVPVVRVYPNGESLIHQNGGDRTYSTGYGGASTCYVECWHGGVNPNRNNGSNWSVGVGVQGNW